MTAHVDQVTTTAEPTLLTWSAPDKLAESRLREGIALTLETEGPAGTTALAERLAERCDPSHPIRSALVVTDPVRAVRDLAGGPAAPVRWLGERAPRPVALLLEGHGAQHVRMGAQLYRRDPVFTARMDECLAAAGAAGDRLRTAWLSDEPGASIDDAALGQPLLFAIGYALGSVVLSWGVRPAALIGHSVGELAAAALAGVLAPADVARLMAARVAGYAEAVPGGVLAVAGTPDDVAGYLGDGVAIGVVNGPRQTMLAGPEPALTAAEDRLRADGRTCVRARIPLPFHSPVLAPLAARSAAVLAGIPLRAPEIEIYSTRTARPLRAAEACDPDFWAKQVCDPVLYWPALDALLRHEDVLLIEAGPSRSLANLARQHASVSSGRSAVAAMLPTKLGGPGADRAAVLSAAAAIWLEGHELDLGVRRDAGRPAGLSAGGAHPPRG